MGSIPHWRENRRAERRGALRVTRPRARGGRGGGARGFSLPELIVALAAILIISAMAVVQLAPSLQQNQSDAAMDQVLEKLRDARQMAIAQRRRIQVQFLGNNTIQLTRMNLPAGTTVISTLTIESPAQFTLEAGLPDTPDGFGNTGAVEFAGVVGGPPTMMFQSDGTFIGPTGTPINGSVFVGVPGNAGTARAVTVLGATGRIRPYRGTGAGWIK